MIGVEIPGGGTICYDPIEEVKREPHGDPRWCFVCRKVRAFEFVVCRPVDRESYYGPSPSIECSECRTSDGDCGFGSAREWE